MADEFEQYRVIEPSTEPSQDEFEQYRVEEKPQESFGTSAALAVPRMFSDLSNSVYNAAQSIPGYFEKAKTELPSLLNVPNILTPILKKSPGEIYQHPLHALGQGAAGINEAINSIAQFPLDVSRYGSERLNLIPQSVTNFIQKMTPEDTTNAINQLFGQPQYAGEAALRGGLRNVVPEVGALKALNALPPLTRRGASRSLREAKKLAAERDIGSLNINPELIEDARQFLPNTLPYRNAFNTAQTGDYNSLFRLQSDVGKNAGDYAKSLFSAAERSHGRAGLQSRNALLDAIHENLQSQGHGDISDLLRQGQNDYRRYINFRPYRNTLALTALGAAALPKDWVKNIGNYVLK